MSTHPANGYRGRGAADNPPNGFQPLTRVPLPEAAEPGDDPAPQAQFFRDHSKSILAKNDSPDLPFTFSLNPYRGCEHGCSYCYARPTHEYLGFSAGLDFETKIMVKEDAPELLRKQFLSPSWVPQAASIGAATDAYQPAERRLRITRRCLEVFAEFRNPVGVVTKSALVTRDADLFAELAAVNAAAVFVTVTTLDPELARKMEPRAAARGSGPAVDPPGPLQLPGGVLGRVGRAGHGRGAVGLPRLQHQREEAFSFPLSIPTERGELQAASLFRERLGL